MKKIKAIDIKAVVSLIVVVVCLAAVVTMTKKTDTVINMPYMDFIDKLENGSVSEVTLSESPKMRFVLDGDDTVYETDNPRSAGLKETLLLKGVIVTEGVGDSLSSIIQSSAGICFFAAALFVGYRMIGRQGGRTAMSLQVTDSAEANPCPATLDDVAGNDEAKDSVADIIEFIKAPGRFEKYGARMPRGIIFHGAPGTGKTLMAKAIAGEAGVPFYVVSGSDFVQMYVGVGAGRVRELFSKARKSGKAVIFIDEIDAIGKKRGSATNGGNDERDQTLNALLTEMSGFKSGEGIVVIAATNRLDTLDEALLRPGRFDRHIEISLPDVAGREKILRLHAANKPLSNDIEFSQLARQTVYFSGAMLENMLNEAAICAANDNALEITGKHIDTAYYAILAGSEKKDRSGIREKDKKIAAFHEAGHALITKLAAPENRISKVSIIPSTKGAGGFCVSIPRDKPYLTKTELRSQIMIALAGRAAEETVFGMDEITTGASNDIEKATAIARDYITKYGMSETFGLINPAMLESEKSVFDECAGLINELYSNAKKLLCDNRTVLCNIADGLMENETLDESDIERIFSLAACRD